MKQLEVMPRTYVNDNVTEGRLQERFTQREIVCVVCGKGQGKQLVILDKSEPDDFFDETICDRCENEIYGK